LSQGQVRQLCEQGFITSAGDNPNPDPSSLDLHLTEEAYKLESGSVKPFGARYLHHIQRLDLTSRLQAENGLFHLKSKTTYLFKVRERLEDLKDGNLHGQATAKSSVGRLDVLARLIVDGMDCYESFDPEGLARGKGEMYLEVTPITFPILVCEGLSLSQLRIFYGEPTDVEMKGRELCQALLHKNKGNGEIQDEYLTVDLSGTNIPGAGKCHAFRAKVDKDHDDIDLRPGKLANPWEYWDPLKNESDDRESRLKIEKNYFYILRSKERLSLPPSVAVYCRAIDETIGEMRIHYAGFAHPFFGYERQDGKDGTPLMFEVRGHDVDISLGDGEKMGRLVFYRMSQDAKCPEESAYGDQTLQLSKYFRDWNEE